MCRVCLKEARPERKNVTIDTGHYISNYAGCAICKSMSLKIEKREEIKDDNDDDLEIMYNHVCSSCDHIVAEHWYSFRIDQEKKIQEYMMECVLCGRGAHFSPYGTNTPIIEQTEQQEKPQSIRIKFDVDGIRSRLSDLIPEKYRVNEEEQDFGDTN